MGPHGKWLFRLKPPFCSVFRPRLLLGPRSSSTVVPGRAPSSYHPTLPSRPSSFSSYKPSFPRGQSNGFGFARPSALPSRTSRRVLALVNPASSPPVKTTTALGPAWSRPSRIMWSGQVDRPYSSFSSPASSSSSCSSPSRYSASSGKKKSNSSSSRRPPSIPPACCEWTHYTAPASTDAKSPSISTAMEVARSRNASGSTSRFVWTTCVVCPRFPLIFLAHSRFVLV